MNGEKEEKKERKPKRIAVKIIAQKGQSALVEWEAERDLHRAYVPATEIKGGLLDEEALAAGIPYGVPWEDLIDVSGLTLEGIGKELRRRGIWTSADIAVNMASAQRAISLATGLTPARLHTLASQYETKEA